MVQFAWPLAFLLLPVPFLVPRLLPPIPGSDTVLYVPATIAERARAVAAVPIADLAGRWLARLLWLALVAALSGPQVIRASDAVLSSGRDIVLTIDLSGSMEKEDFTLDGERISRLDAVKRVASRFAARRKGDRIGLVIFADKAFFATPLTWDVAAVAREIEQAAIGVSGRSTAISDGLGLAVKRLVASDAPTRVVVLLSDGIDTAAKTEARDVGALAARHGIRIHSIALGPEDTESDPAGRDVVDAVTLRAIAKASEGESFRVRSMDDLTAMAEALDRLEPNPSDRPPLLVAQELWVWPATLAFAAALGLGLLWRRE